MLIIAILITFILTEQASNLIKVLIQRPRPSHNSELEGLLHFVNNYRGGQFGFVSSHAANTFGLATIVSLIFRNKTWVVAMFLWASIVAYSRIYLGVHYPTDILCGAALGILIAFMVYRGLKLIESKKATVVQRP
ncbi:MAG TPA: phosphatase PAP2 family protein [Salinivirgaceae bacterium]|nr:phosphatase PAP2 family protein [Salinivirgaceae bacterium]